jgi:hypothetical protein
MLSQLTYKYTFVNTNMKTNFIKLTDFQQHNVKIFYPKFYPKWTVNVENIVQIHLCPQINCGFHCIHFHKTLSHSLTHPPTCSFATCEVFDPTHTHTLIH